MFTTKNKISIAIGIGILALAIIGFDYFGKEYGMKMALYYYDVNRDYVTTPYLIGKYVSLGGIVLSIIIILSNVLMFIKSKKIIANPFSNKNENVAKKLEDLSQLKTKGIITDDEFLQKKKELLENM